MLLNKKHSLYQEDLQNILSVRHIDQLRGKSILITGATGLIGVMLIDALMLMGDVKVYAVGRNKAKAATRLGEYYDNPLFEFIEQDVVNPLPNIQVDYIIPGASNTHPLAYSQYPIETMFINIKGAEHALNLATQTGAMVLYMSSVEVYGNAYGEDPFTEDYTGKLNLATSRACYTESKRACEALCQSYAEERGVKISIARLSRIFGPTMLESDSKASSQFIKKAINNEDIVLKSEGNQFFSYTYVADAITGMLTIILNGAPQKAYNISSNKTNVHLREFAQICANYNNKQVVFDLPSETERKGFSVAMQAILDNLRISKIGFEAKYDMQEAVYRTIDILKNKEQ